MKFTIEISCDNKNWNLYKQINNHLFEQILNEVLVEYKNFSIVENIELSVLLTSDKKITELNRNFRKKNSATNVLSFPDMEIDFREILEFKPNVHYMYLGDIAFAFETILRESKEKEISFLNHFTHLLIHSILHLIGYDHRSNKEEEVMQNIEVKILQRLSISSPY